MKNYKRRGYGYLLAAACVFLFGLIMLLAFEKARYYGVGLMITSLVYLPAFFAYRGMTEGQFAEKAKKELKQFDERNMQIAFRTCRVALVAGLLSLSAGTIFFTFIYPNKVAVLATVGYLAVIVPAIFIAHAVYSRKM